MPQQYRAHVQQAPQRSPHATARRGGIGPMMSAGPHPAVPLTQAQLAQQQQAQAQATELAKRRSIKPTDKSIPDGVEDSVINPDSVQRYRDLKDIERLLDATITRKRLDVLDSMQHATKLTKTLRIWVSNTVQDQIWQGNISNAETFDFSGASEASYCVKIEGRLLDDMEDNSKQLRAGDSTVGENGENGGMMDGGDAANEKPATSSNKLNLSHFFKAMSVEFDRSRYRNGAEQSVEWKKPDVALRNSSVSNLPTAADFDELTFKRNGDENTNITINLFRHETPEVYQLSTELENIVDMKECTQQEAVIGLWEYIRQRGLQEDEEKRNFRCDELLKKVVGRGDVGFIPMLNEYVAQHLRPLPPVSLPYTIRVDEEFHKDPQPTIYDIQVKIDDPLRSKLQELINHPKYVAMLKAITLLDDDLAKIVQAISFSKAKHTFMKSLGNDPATFVRNWLSSQKRDLEVIMGEGSNGGDNGYGDEWRRGGSNSIWATQTARESVNVLLSRQR